MAMVQTGYAGFDKGNSVTEILKCSVGKLSMLSTQEYISKPTLLRLNYLQADFLQKYKISISFFPIWILPSSNFTFSCEMGEMAIREWWHIEKWNSKGCKHAARCTAGELVFLQFVPSSMQMERKHSFLYMYCHSTGMTIKGNHM